MTTRSRPESGTPDAGPDALPRTDFRRLARDRRRVIDVAAGLVFREGKLLITQRHAKDHLGGLWEFPGGKREPGETFEQCLIRELREELGIDVTVAEMLDTLTHEYPKRTIRLKFFRCGLRSGEPRTLDCAAFKWIGVEGLDHHAFPAADGRLLEKLKNAPALWGR